MDSAQEEDYHGAAKEESDHYSWLAGALVGGFLILMMVIIIGIIIRKYVKNKNTSKDQNWAGPSPLADGNIPEVGNCMNSIFARSMSLSHISLSPIISNEQEVDKKGEDMQQGQQEEANGEKTKATLAINIPTVPAAADNASPAPGVITYSQMIGLNDETFPPPPLNISQELPLPSPPGASPEQAVEDNPLQPFPEMHFYQQGENGIQEPLNLQMSDVDAENAANKTEDHLLPPPPPDF